MKAKANSNEIAVKPTFLIVLLTVQTLALVVYSTVVMLDHGLSLFPVYFGNMLEVNWVGQFNLDFTFYLLLSGLWIVWRNRFSGRSIALAAVASVVGYMAFAPYLIYLIIKEKGDLRKVAIGKR